MLKRKKKLSVIEKALRKRGEVEYKKGAEDAISVAINLFNVKPEIRALVFKVIFQKTE